MMPGIIMEKTIIRDHHGPRVPDTPDGPVSLDPLARAETKHGIKYKEFACGWGAAVINIGITFPLNKAMFRQQLHGFPLKDAVRQLRKEGMRNLYRGILPPLLQKTTCLSIMFGMYEQYRQILQSNAPNLPVMMNQIISANLAGCTEALLTPFERVQTLLQDRKHQKRFKNTAHAFRDLSDFGFREYYRGVIPILLRNGPSNALFFTLRGPMKEMLPTVTTTGGHLLSDFIGGAILGAVISTIFFPVNVIKTRMQSQVGAEGMTTKQTFKLIWRERGKNWTKMFYGVHINYSRSLISWGVINASYELLKRLLDW
ncbi:mitochondrial nicotinamide adenine dinucleotide transporter SLC25A51-like [Lineus longissimus]|uniref:mitochondrial nicotinamide adenine dinucleotide transporter SLC25A51-like n=1 Tax=Lineus longissimus TaxID=88925 RepID=UPI002B4C5D2B